VTDSGADLLRDRVGARVQEPFCAVLVEAGETTVAVHDVPRDGDVELGSVSKGITGLLLHDAIDRGEVTLGTRLGDLLDVNSDVGALTLGRLATHTSGLPRLAPGTPFKKTWRWLVHAENPYGESLDELFEQLRTVRPKGDRASYSNLGFMLLGHAVAAAAGTGYASLARSRLFEPVGMTGAYVADSPEALTSTAVRGHTRRGQEAEPWTGEALGPAGGVRATVDDLALFVRALLCGAAPGIAALTPVRDFAGEAVRIGAGWLTSAVKDRHITWHNGGTGGFRSYVGLDLENQRGVAVVRASPRSADRVGLDLLGGQ